MDLNIGGLLGFMWARDRQEKDAAYQRFFAVALEVDRIFQAMQDVIVDHRDEAIAAVAPRLDGLEVGSVPHLRELRRGLRPWALRDRPVLQGYADDLQRTKATLRLLPGWQHIEPAARLETPRRIDEIISVIWAWIAFFDMVTDGSGPGLIAEFNRANAAWTELFNLVEARAAVDGMRARR